MKLRVLGSSFDRERTEFQKGLLPFEILLIMLPAAERPILLLVIQ